MASIIVLTTIRRKSIRFLGQCIKTVQSHHNTFLTHCCNQIYFYNNRTFIFNKNIGLQPIQFNSCRYSSETVGILSCWNCGITNTEELFCRKCKVLQQPNLKQTYFDVLKVEQKYHIEPTELTTKYRRLQNVLHPDRFSNRKPEELKISEDYSSLVNKAYFTLLQPLSRGLYMLELQGVFIDQGTTVTSPDFLMEIMERNQEVEEATAEQLRELTSRNQASLSVLDKEVGEAFTAGNITLATELVVKMKYYASIATTIKDLKQRRHLED